MRARLLVFVGVFFFLGGILGLGYALFGNSLVVSRLVRSARERLHSPETPAKKEAPAAEAQPGDPAASPLRNSASALESAYKAGAKLAYLGANQDPVLYLLSGNSFELTDLRSGRFVSHSVKGKASVALKDLDGDGDTELVLDDETTPTPGSTSVQRSAFFYAGAGLAAPLNYVASTRSPELCSETRPVFAEGRRSLRLTRSEGPCTDRRPKGKSTTIAAFSRENDSAPWTPRDSAAEPTAPTPRPDAATPPPAPTPQSGTAAKPPRTPRPAKSETRD